MKISVADIYFPKLKALVISARGIESELPKPEELRSMINADVIGLLFDEYMRGSFGALDFSFMCNIMPNISYLRIVSSQEHSNYGFVTEFKKLNALYLDSHQTPIVLSSPLIPNLHTFKAIWFDNYNTILKYNESIEDIWIDGFPHEDLRSIPQLPNLRKLRIRSHDLNNLRGLENFPNLISLQIQDGKKMKSLSGLDSAPLIERLDLGYLPEIQGINEIKELKHLKELFLFNCSKITNLQALSRCFDLETIQVNGMQIETLKPLEDLPKLTWLLLSEKTKVKDNDTRLMNKIMKNST